MALAFVIKNNKPLVNGIVGLNLYYTNQPIIDPEIGVSVGLWFWFLTFALRFERAR